MMQYGLMSNQNPNLNNCGLFFSRNATLALKNDLSQL